MEICVDTIESARNAIEGGATRLEVCSALSEGGLTPTPGSLHTIKSFSPIPVYVMLRVRGGNFVYSEEEKDAMLRDLLVLKNEADGIVFGALMPNGEIDAEFCKTIVSAAELPVTFHRAFDEVANPFESLDTLIHLGFERILTSGQKDTAVDGLELIQKLVEKAGDKIIVMPGSGITKDNILKIKRDSGAKEFHASAKNKALTTAGGNKVKIGDTKESCVTVTDKNLVQEMVKIITNAT